MDNNMTVACVGKTPVSVLQELLSRRGTTPRYELVQIEGAIHEPTFRYRVTVADVVAMGTGRSKKEAKHAAAKALLDKMIVGPGDEGSLPVGNTNSMPEVKHKHYVEHSEDEGNPESVVDRVESADEIMETGECSPVASGSKFFPQGVKSCENSVLESAETSDRENSIPLLDWNSVSPKRGKNVEDAQGEVVEFLNLKKLELSIELMEMDIYMKSLEILKLERDLNLSPSKFTYHVLDRQPTECPNKDQNQSNPGHNIETHDGENEPA